MEASKSEWDAVNAAVDAVVERDRYSRRGFVLAHAARLVHQGDMETATDAAMLSAHIQAHEIAQASKTLEMLDRRRTDTLGV